MQLIVKEAPLTFTPMPLPDAIQGQAYNVVLVPSGGIGSGYGFTASGLPAGMDLKMDGTFVGAPSASGTFNVTITLHDGSGNSATF